MLAERATSLVRPLGLPLPVPVGVHARYTRDETLAAFGSGTAAKPPTFREGPWWDKANGCDVFFVTLAKAEKDYSPTTLYRDYAISQDLFHWESQSTTSDTSPTGQRYINHHRDGSDVLLFVREYRTSRFGTTMPYMALGPATYVQHEGSRPMAITWRCTPPCRPNSSRTPGWRRGRSPHVTLLQQRGGRARSAVDRYRGGPQGTVTSIQTRR